MKTRIIYILFFLQLISNTIYSQSLYKHFSSLTAPEKCWAIKHLFVAKKAYWVTQEALDATRQILHDSVLDNYTNGGQADAFRHTYWMARMTKVIGAKKAESLGKAHEKGNYKSFKKSNYEDGALPDKQSTMMDLFNNEVGISIGKNDSIKSASELKIIIINSIKKGTMKILKRDAKGHFLNCDGQIVEPLKIKTWDLPYCLVPSDQLP